MASSVITLKLASVHEKATQLFQGLDRAKLTEDFLAAAVWLKSRPDTTGKLGAVGFCFGGGAVNQLAVQNGYRSCRGSSVLRKSTKRQLMHPKSRRRC
jgi:dienelactone hydrolase